MPSALDSLPQDVQLRIAEMLAAHAPCTDMTAASLALARSSHAQCRAVSRALNHSLTLRFETDAVAWAQLMRPTVRSLHILTFGSPRNHAAFRRLLCAPNLQHVRMPCARHLLCALHNAPNVRSLFLTSYVARNNAALLALLPTLPALRSLRIDACALTLLLLPPPRADAHLLWRIAHCVPQLAHLDMFVHLIEPSLLASALSNFESVTSLTLRTKCDSYPLYADLRSVFERVNELSLHGFCSALMPRVGPPSGRTRDLCTLIAAKLVELCECTTAAMAMVALPKLRVLDTVVGRRHRVPLPPSLQRVTLRWQPMALPKRLVPALSPWLTQRLRALPHVRSVALHNVLVCNDTLHALLSALGAQLLSLTVPLMLQLRAPADRLHDVLHLCARHCAPLRELQVSEMRCTNFSSCGPAAAAQPPPSFSSSSPLGPHHVRRLHSALTRLCRRAPLLDERPINAVISMMQCDMSHFERYATRM